MTIRSSRSHCAGAAAALFVAAICCILPRVSVPEARAAEERRTVLRTEHFDRDPGWDALNNRIVPEHVPTVTQDFGYSATRFAAKEPGEVGGKVTRSTRCAYYADRIPAKGLNDRLSASGTFALTASTPGGGVFFGWFRAQQPGGSGRPVSSLGLDFDGEHSGGRLAVRMINQTNKACGTFITPFIPGKFRPTPIKNDGTRYRWTLAYDPEEAGGRGRFEFTIRSDSPKPEEFEGKAFGVDLPVGFKQEGAVFDRFGMMNLMKSGGSMTLHFADLKHDGKSDDLTRDPGWAGSGNRDTYEDREQAGAHDFGFSPATHHAGGAAGEVGGGLWRSGKYGYYADRVGSLSLNDRLEASGKVVLLVGGPDSDMYFGWFNSAARGPSPAEAGNFLGVHVGGPTRIGHYFQPWAATSSGTVNRPETAPILTPGKVFEWTLVYDPAANDGAGELRATLGKESLTFPLKPGFRGQGASFDRFGLCTSNIGGQLVKVYFDDLKYTAARSGE